MPDILIRGMEMPPENTFDIVYIYSDGSIAIPTWGKGVAKVDNLQAVELPQHGDLIDRRELLSTVMQVVTKFPTNNIAAIEHLDLVSALLRGATVVVPAERRDADA